jgi:hypothetical protein
MHWQALVLSHIIPQILNVQHGFQASNGPLPSRHFCGMGHASAESRDILVPSIIQSNSFPGSLQNHSRIPMLKLKRNASWLSLSATYPYSNMCFMALMGTLSFLLTAFAATLHLISELLDAPG